MATTTDVAKNGARGGPGAARTAPTRSPSTVVASATQRLARRNRTRIALGAFLVVACALAAVVLFSRAGDRHPVLAVTHRVSAGSTISASDLEEVMMSADANVGTVPASQRAQLVGQVATVDLVPGSLIAPGQFDARPRDTASEAIVGATLKEGQFPPGLRDGDRVLIIEVPADNASNSNTTSTSVNGTVVSVDPSTAQGGVTVSLAVDPSHAQSVAVDAARGHLTLVIASA